jgi:hypothetical protein
MLKKIWADVWGRVITAVIGAMVTAGGAYFAGWWPSITTAVSKIVPLVVASTLIPNWLLVPIFLLAAFGVFRLFKDLYSRIAPDWYDYRQETFFDIVWRWGYDRGNITVPAPFCPSCDTRMRPGPAPGENPHHPKRTVYHCGNCDNRVTINDSPTNTLEKIVLQIERECRKRGR